MSQETAEILIEFLKRQKEVTGCPLPHRHHLVVEFVSVGPGGSPQAVMHTLWGGRVNRPLAMALDSAWRARFGHRLELYVGNDAIVFQLPHGITGEELLSLVESRRVESLLRTRLEGSGFFGARFRECAARALLLPRGNFNQRMPLWMSRLRSQKLLEVVLNYKDFPILLETWRTCMQDEFDLESLKRVLAELESGSIVWTEVHTSHPSPFAQSDWWRQVNQYMYMDDSPKGDKVSKLRGSFLREVAFNAGLRPTVTRDLVSRFELKRKRLSPGYSPQTTRELLDWLEERVVIPKGEWEDLSEAMQRDHGFDPKESDDLQDRIVVLHPEEAKESLVASREMLPQIADALYRSETQAYIESLGAVAVPVESSENGATEGDMERRTSLLGQWLQYYGPVTFEFLSETFGIETGRLHLALEDLVDSQKVIQGQLVTDGPSDAFCDSENFEALLRLARKESIPSFDPLGIEWLPLFLANYQRIAKPHGDIDGLYDCIEQLLCYPAEAATWESEIFPARLDPYDPSWLDTLMQEGDLLWMGSEGHKVVFCFESDLDLLKEEPEERNASLSDEDDEDVNDHSQTAPLTHLFPDPAGRYGFLTLLQASGKNDKELAKQLWSEVWQGRVTNDTFLALRRAIMSRFKSSDPAIHRARRSPHRMRRRESMVEKETSRFLAGSWHLVPTPEPSDGLLETEERRKDRARLLLDRYGILFRELLQREFPSLRWSSIFRALRIMELSGEVMSGIFFHGIPGPQFTSHRAFRSLQRKLREDTIYWINATDPASVCGIPLDSLRGLPARLVGNHLVYHGNKLVLISKRNGKDLTIFVPPDDPHLAAYMVSLRHLLTRKFQPSRRITIETINDEEAPRSPYLPVLRTSFDVAVDYRDVTLYRKAG